MKHTITISEDVYQQLADLAIGFDTPEKVIQRLIDNFHSSGMHENKLISNKKVPNSEHPKEVMRALETAKEKQSNKSIDCPPDIKKEVISEIGKPKKTDEDLVKEVSKVPESIEDIYLLVKNVYEKKVAEQDAKNI